jgi:ABC-2 type transport system ATP-binding protein
MIQLAEVVKEYTGWLGPIGGRRVRALGGVTLHVPPGTALGIVGPNGAGKSTLIRLLLGYLRPTRGEVTIAGLPPRHYAERQGIGYVPERVEIPPRWTVRGALQAYAALGNVDRAALRIDKEMRRLGIEELAERQISALSKGNLQRVALAQALLGERKLLVLDEPTDGLDPEWVARTREILTRWRAADAERVLLFASHNLDEVERVADRVAVLQDGRLREVIELHASAPSGHSYRLELHGTDEAAAAAVEQLFPGATPAADGTNASAEGAQVFRVTAPDLPELNRRVRLLIERGATIHALVPERPSLEQQFRRSLREE